MYETRELNQKDAAQDVERRAFAKIAWRLMPFLIVAYVLNYLDRNNVGFAALTMNREIGLTLQQFGYAGGILFLGYCLFEVPSNIALYRVGARVWLSRIMISWGLVSAATIFVTGPIESVFPPFSPWRRRSGVLPRGRVLSRHLVSHRVPHARRLRGSWSPFRCRRSSVARSRGCCWRWMASAGLAGWKWLFLLEGLPVTVLGVAALWVLADRPEGTTVAHRRRAAGGARPLAERAAREGSPSLRDGAEGSARDRSRRGSVWISGRLVRQSACSCRRFSKKDSCRISRSASSPAPAMSLRPSP